MANRQGELFVADAGFFASKFFMCVYCIAKWLGIYLNINDYGTD